MREKIIAILIFCLPVVFFAQEKTPHPYKDLKVGQELFFTSSKVKLVKVLSDSRCPQQVTCMWAGEAIVLLGISRGGNYTEREIVVNRGVELALQEDLQLVVSRLRPYPVTANGIALNEYSLEFIVLRGPKDQ